MSKKEFEKYKDDAVTVDDNEVQQVVDRCLKFRWSLPNEESFRSEIRDSAAQEARANPQQIVLTDLGHTPEMESVIFSRLLSQTSEWVEVKTEFTNMLAPHSELLEESANLKDEKARLEQQRNDLKNLVTKEWEEKKKDFRDDRNEAAEAEKQYNKLYEKSGNRHAKLVNHWFYVPLLAAIGFVEWMVNWEAANALFAQPFLAAGIVILIALAVAAASHEHGTLVKQWSYRCGFAADRQTRSRNYTALVLTTVLFTAAMVLVGYMRYKLAYNDLVGASTFGGSNPFGARGSVGEVYVAVTMTLMGNLIVWILGALIAYWAHDSNPNFAEARVRHIKASSRFEVWSKRMEKAMREKEQHLTMQIEEVENTLNSRANKGRLLVDKCEQVHDHEEMLFNQMKNLVDDHLRSYRRTLLAIVKAEQPRLAFLDVHKGALSAVQYETQQIELPINYLVQRMQFGPFIERRAAKRRAVEGLSS